MFFLDRRILSPPASYSADTDTTTWTIPYSVPVDGAEGELAVILTDDGAQIETTRPSSTTIAATGQGDLSSRPVSVGVLYTWRYTPTLPYIRTRDGKPDLTSDLLLKRCALHYAEAAKVIVEIQRQGRPGVSVQRPLSRTGFGKLSFPLGVRREDVVWLTFTDTSPYSIALTGLTWIGQPIIRARPI